MLQLNFTLEQAIPYLNWGAVALGIVASMAGAAHALFNKRDPRSAAAWVAICLMWPLVGAVIYLLMGKNRIKTRARQLHGTAVGPQPAAKLIPPGNDCSAQLEGGFQSLSNLSAATSLLPTSRNTPSVPGLNSRSMKSCHCSNSCQAS